MQFPTAAFILLVAAQGVFADLHHAAVCVTNRQSSPVGGTAFSPSYTWSTTYEILPDATNCACTYYRNRNTGDEQWDQCPDCIYDGNTCNSAAKHIGGDEFTYYCEELCGADGAEAD